MIGFSAAEEVVDVSEAAAAAVVLRAPMDGLLNRPANKITMYLLANHMHHIITTQCS